MTIEFRAWPKTPRLYRDITITEKIDGTNAAVIVDPEPLLADWERGHRFGDAVVVNIEGRSHLVGAQSRKRLITPEDDNYGFARWVFDNAQALANTLGPGYHYGEWWGSGIQRRYGLSGGDKRFSLFNVKRYANIDPTGVEGLGLVPVLYQGPFSESQIRHLLAWLRQCGSAAAPGFMDPEGIIVHHSQSGQVYKVLLDNDHLPKSAAGQSTLPLAA